MPVKLGTLYATPACPGQTVAAPVIVPSGGGTPIVTTAGVLWLSQYPSVLLLLIRQAAQYVVLPTGLWVKDAPVPSWVPANCALYQIIFEHPEAVTVTDPGLHREAPVVVGAVTLAPVTVSTSILL